MSLGFDSSVFRQIKGFIMKASKHTFSDCNVTEVWAVVGGHDYEGEDFSSLELYYDHEDAKKAHDRMVKDFDYVKIEVVDLN